jgi:hypothetical protein
MPNPKGWALELSPWGQLEKLVGDIRPVWKRTVLDLGHRSQVPPAPGVYAIEFPAPIQLGACREESRAPIRAPIYIGKSHTSILDRFKAHTSDDPQDLIALARKLPRPPQEPWIFIWAQIRGADKITNLETALIDCFNPPCNKIRGARLADGRPAGALP